MFFVQIHNTGNKLLEISSSFEGEGRFPGVIGIIDGTHIRIRAPESEPEAYINRKKFHSLNVQVKSKNEHTERLSLANFKYYSIFFKVVCDDNMLFTDVLAGWPGSVHDSRLLRNSVL